MADTQNNNSTSIDDILSSITGFLSNGNSILGEGSAEIANMFNSTISDVFGNSHDTEASKLNTPVADAVKANFGKGTPRAGVYVTSNLEGKSIVPSTVRTNSTDATGNVVSQRYGVAKATSNNSLYDTVSNAFKNSAIGSVFADTKNIVGKTVAPITDTAGKTLSAVNQVGDEYRQLTGGLASAFNQNVDFLQRTLDNSLTPSLAMVNGNYDSLLSQSSSTSINAILKAASSAKCQINGISTDMFRAKQSLYNTLLSLTSNLHMKPILSQLLQCSRFDDSSIGITRNLFKQNLTGYLDNASELYGKLDNSDCFLSDEEVKDAYRHADSSDVPDLQKIIDKAKIDRETPLKSYNDNLDSSPVYDLDVLSGSDAGFLSSMFSDSPGLSAYSELNAMT